MASHAIRQGNICLNKVHLNVFNVKLIMLMIYIIPLEKPCQYVQCTFRKFKNNAANRTKELICKTEREG